MIPTYIEDDAHIIDADELAVEDYGSGITLRDDTHPEEPALTFTHEHLDPPEITVAITHEHRGESTIIYTTFYPTDAQLEALHTHISNYLEGK